MATREEYMKKYGLTTGGRIKSDGETVTDRIKENAGQLSEQAEAALKYKESLRTSSSQKKAATRADYMKKYGPTTSGVSQGLTADRIRTQYQADKERKQAAQEYAAQLQNQTPKYQGTSFRPLEGTLVSGAKGKNSLSGQAYVINSQDKDAMIAAGKEKPSLFKADDSFLGLGNWNLDLIRHRGSGYNYTYMDEEQKDAYYYLLGKYGLDAADDYMKSIKDTLNERSYSAVAENVKEKSKENAAIGLTGNLAGSLMSSVGYVEDIANKTMGRGYDPYGIGHGASMIEEKSREGLKEAARENLWDSSGMDFLTDTGLSMAQSLFRLPMGEAGSVYAGLGAATQATEDAMDRGAEFKQALDQGAAQGIAEGLFERYSIGNLQSMQDVPVYALKDIGKNLLKQAGVEASEEMATELANSITDQLIMGEKSNYNKSVEEYMAQGNTEEIAKVKALQDIGKNILLAGAGGALSGGLMGGGFAAYNGVQQARLGRSSDITNYQEIADTMDVDPASYENAEDLEKVQSVQKLAQEYADRQARGEELTNLEKGGFERDLYEMETSLMESQGKQKEKEGIAPVQIPEAQRTSPVQQNRTAEQRTFGNETQTPDPGSYEGIQEFSKNLGSSGKEAFVANYDGNTLISDYQTAFGRYYDAGRYDVDMEAADKFAMSAILTPEQAAAAYKAGAQDRNLAAKNRPSYIQGTEKTGSMTDLTGRATADQTNVLSSIGKKTGLNFEIIESQKNAMGSYNSKKGVIQVAVDSDNFLQTTSHELTHFIKDYAPDHYEGYKSIAVSALMQAQGVDYNTLYRNYEARYEESGTAVTRDDVIDEIVADATGKFLNDEEFIKNIAKDDRTIAQKIIDFLSDMIESIKNLISGKGIRKAAEGLQEQLDYYENARDMWAYALEEAGNRYKSGSEIADKEIKDRFMLAHPEEVSDAKIEENYDYVRNMDPVVTLKGDEFTGRDKKISDQVMEYYNSMGNVVHNDIVGDILLKKRSVKDDVAHGIGRLKSITFQAVPDVLRDGKILQLGKNWKNRGYDTVSIGARVDIAGGEKAGKYYVVCIVKVDESNRMYLHEVHTTKMDDTTPFWTGGDQKAVLPGGENHPSISSIFKKLVNVKEGAENADGSVKFQLKDPMEETKNLIAVHNLTADKLLKTLQYEGIPMPSIAITKADIGHENFGEISLLFRKDTIDPKKKKNKVYSADAWTPTFPRIEYEANKDVIRNASAFVEKFKKHLPEEYYLEARRTMDQLEEYLQTEGSEKQVANRLKEKTAVKALYMASQGDTIEEKTKVVRSEKEKNPMFDEFLELFEEDIETLRKTPYNVLREKYVDRMKEVAIKNGRTEKQAEMLLAKKSGIIGGFSKMMDRLIRYAEKPGVTETTVIDYESMRKDIESRIDNAGFEMWVDNLVSGLSQNMGISNGKELFTSAGKQRSFEDTHFAVTAKNIVKSMLTQGENVKNIAGFHGIKTIRAAAADEFKSIKDIKAAGEKIQNFTKEEFEEISDRLSDRLYKVIDGILTASVNDTDYNRLTQMDYIGELIQEACENPTEENIRKQFANTLWKVTDEQVREIKSIIDDTRNMPVNMFEAKPQRVVDYDEIEAAVVPDDVPAEVLEALDEKGIRTVTYNAAEQGSRAKAVNSVEGIRFQLQDVDESSDLDSLLSENKELKKANEYLEQQLNSTKDYAPGLEDIGRIADKLRKDYNSTYSKKNLEENLGRLYNYIRNSEHVDGSEVTYAATAIGRSVLEQAQMKDTSMKEQYQDVLKRVKTIKIVLPENNRADMDSVGGYNSFRKKYFGKIRIGNEGIGVDTAYQELSSLYPDLFDPTIINPANQLMKIAEVVDSIRPQVVNPYHADIDELSMIVGQEIVNSYFDVRSLEPTRRDRMDAQVYEIRKKYEEQLNAYKTRLKAEYESDLTQAEKEVIKRRREISERMKQLGDSVADRAEKKRLTAENRDLENSVNMDQLIGKMKYQRKRDASESRRHKDRIMKDVQDMTNWLANPTDQKHVPEQLKVQLSDFLKEIDYSSTRKTAAGDPTERTVKWTKLQNLYAAISQNGTISGEDGTEIYMEIDPDIVDKMSELTEKVRNFDRLDDLDLKDLRSLREVVQSMKHSIQDANRVLQNKNYEHVEDGARAFTQESAERRSKLERAGTLGKLDKMLRSDMLDAYTMFNRMGPAASSFYQEIRDGFDRKVRNTKLAQDYMADLMEKNGIKSDDIQKWSGQNAESHEFKLKGGTIRLTTAQVMSLYALNQREQARGHIYSATGGIKSAPEVKKTKTGLVIEKSYRPVTCTSIDIDHIIETLTPEQKLIADGIVKFFTTQTSEWGNEVSMKLYGYKKFMAPNYFPIVSDKNYIATKESELGSAVTMSTLRNMGATKATVYKANNPIIIEDIFDVFTRQADQMGSYNAFVVPLSDMQKFFNFKQKGVGSVKQEIERTFGKDGLDYVRQLMVDVNGMGRGSQDISSVMIRNMKSAAVGANLRTAIQQPTAYVRAMAEIDPKYLIQGLKIHVPDSEWELAKQYCPIAQWKDWGYFDINTGRSMKNILLGPESMKERIVEGSMWLAGKGDEVAWKRLWEASKAETRDLYPELEEGSEAFYEQAGKRLGEIVDRTQVVDSVLHRSKMMKDKNGLVQMYTSFMSEPTKSYNMIYRAIADVALNNNAENRKKAGRILGVWVLNGVATSLAAAVIDAMRDDEDEEYNKKYLLAVGENLLDNLNPVNMIPIAKDVVSIFQGYQVQRTDMQAVQQLYYASQKVLKFIDGDSSLTIPGLALECSKSLSTLSGVPVNNALRDVNAAVDTMLQAFGNVDAIYTKEKMMSDIHSTDNLSLYVGLAMKAYSRGNKDTGDKIINDLKEAGIDEDKIKSKYKTALKNDQRINEAAEARLSSDTKTYERILNEMENDGYIREYVLEAVASAGNQMDGTAHLQGGSLYMYGDAVKAFKTSKEDFNRVCDMLIESKKEEAKESGKEFKESDVISSIKSRFTTEYKEAYQKGNDAERAAIRKELYTVKVKGQQLYSEKDFQNWIKEKK